MTIDRLALQLEILLEDAQKAHHLDEIRVRNASGDPNWTDPNWPKWYGRYLAARLRGGALEIEPIFVESLPSVVGELGDYPDEGEGYGHAV